MPNTAALRLRYLHFAADLAEHNDPKVLMGLPLGCNPSRGNRHQARKLPQGSKIAALWGFGSVAGSGIGEFMAEPIVPSTPQRPDPNEKLVKVFDSELESEALVVKGLLDAAGIDSDLTSASMVQDAFPMGGMIILVRQEDADRARRLIEEQRQKALDEDDETAEIEAISEEPPQKA